MVAKKNSTWHMCIGYRLINKACPKNLALLHIGQVIDSTVGCERLCFLDAYSGYRQIKMNESVAEKASFIMPLGPYCYVSMPFI